MQVPSLSRGCEIAQFSVRPTGDDVVKPWSDGYKRIACVVCACVCVCVCVCDPDATML